MAQEVVMHEVEASYSLINQHVDAKAFHATDTAQNIIYRFHHRSQPNKTPLYHKEYWPV